MIEREENGDPNCNRFEDGKCVKCSFGFYFNKHRKCSKKPDECLDFDEEEEKCETCYSGYELDDNNDCVVKIDEVSDPNCNKFENGKCVRCSNGFYFDEHKNCVKIPD